MKYTTEKAAEYTLALSTAEMVMDTGASYATESDTAQTLAVAGEKVQLDASAKRLVAQKPILAHILKSALEEYADVPVERIAEECIEGTPQVSRIAVHQDHADAVGEDDAADGDDAATADDSEADGSNEVNESDEAENSEVSASSGQAMMSGSDRIVGMANEDSSIKEGTVLFDIRFAAWVPRDDSRMDIIVNIEVQNTDTPGYPITKRGIYYGARLLSAQRGTLFKNQEYGKIRKVATIWICEGTSQERSDTINEYAITELNRRGQYREKREDYDLMRMVVMRLGAKGEDSSDPAIRLLSRLFSPTRDEKSKKAVLSEEYHIAVTEEINQEVGRMCNLSEGIYDKGVQKGRFEGLQEGFQQGQREGVQSGLRAGRQEGRLQTLFELIMDGETTIDRAAKRMNMEPSQFEKEYKAYLLAADANQKQSV